MSSQKLRFCLPQCAGMALLMLLLGHPAALSADTLKGHIEKKAEIVSDMLQGQVIDSQTQHPIPEAQVTVPDRGFSMRTDKQGRYRVPFYQGRDPVIMSIEKPGYAPFSLSITENAPPTFTIRLEKQGQRLVLDNQLRHLGDGSFSPYSSAALKFRKPPDGPAIRIPFKIDPASLGENPTLRIGSVIGLDTPLEHMLRGSMTPNSASPLLIKINSSIIARLQVNGDNIAIKIPKHLLKSGQNTLEIEAGYHYPEPDRLDYDDMELIHLVLIP